MNILPQHNLKALNTLGVSEVVDYYISCDTVDDLLLLSKDEFFRTLPFVPMGEGSNLLFVERFKGGVVHYLGNTVVVDEIDEDTVLVTAEAGKNWNDLVEEMVARGYWGIENLVKIPGNVGAAAVQNIGAYGVEVCDVVKQVHCVDLRTGQLCTLSVAECRYGYRESVFKHTEYAHLLVYKVELLLRKHSSPILHYAGLQHLAIVPDLTPELVSKEVAKIRTQKLPDPSLLPNAGSFFMNPIVEPSKIETLKDLYPEIPYYRFWEKCKIPAAWLIEQVGYKGKRLGKVGCYERQPLVVVNYDGASGQEIVDFAQTLIQEVKKKFAIELRPEVRYLDWRRCPSLNDMEQS